MAGSRCGQNCAYSFHSFVVGTSLCGHVSGFVFSRHIPFMSQIQHDLAFRTAYGGAAEARAKDFFHKKPFSLINRDKNGL